MNKQQAKEIAQKLHAKGVSGYSGVISIRNALNMDKKELTESGANKVLKEFQALVADSQKYPIIEKMYAQEQMK